MYFQGGIKCEYWLLALVNIPFQINPSVASFSIILPENTEKPEVFRRYQMGTLTGNGLILNRERENIGTDAFVLFFCSEDLNYFEVLTSNSPHDINTYFGLKLKRSLS